MDRAVQFLVCHGDAVLFTWVFAEQAGLPIPTSSAGGGITRERWTNEPGLVGRRLWSDPMRTTCESLSRFARSTYSG